MTLQENGTHAPHSKHMLHRTLRDKNHVLLADFACFGCACAGAMLHKLTGCHDLLLTSDTHYFLAYYKSL